MAYLKPYCATKYIVPTGPIRLFCLFSTNISFLTELYSPIVKINQEPIEKVAKMLRKHKHLILNWFKADGRLSSGTVEGFNLKAKLTMRKAYSFAINPSL